MVFNGLIEAPLVVEFCRGRHWLPLAQSARLDSLLGQEDLPLAVVSLKANVDGVPVDSIPAADRLLRCDKACCALDQVDFEVFFNCLLVFVFNEVERASLAGELEELHDVAGESACFVGEDVLDLAQLLVDVRRLRVHLEPLLCVVHIDVPSHEGSLPELDEFEGDDDFDTFMVQLDKQREADELETVECVLFDALSRDPLHSAPLRAARCARLGPCQQWTCCVWVPVECRL